jgi:glycerol uptake facilitator-like aquaporin
MSTRRSALSAEFIGSLLLSATVIGSGIMGERLAQGALGLALLSNTLATCGMLVALILSFAPVSGAHFNPAVSMVLALRGELAASRLLAYVMAQVLGMIGGAILAHAMFDLPLWQVSSRARTGIAQWTSEFVASFVLLLVIIRVAKGRTEIAVWATPLAVASVILAGYWFTASTSFANPAITLARSLTDTFAGIAPLHGLAFISAQLLGAIAAWLCDTWAFSDARSSTPL